MYFAWHTTLKYSEIMIRAHSSTYKMHMGSKVYKTTYAFVHYEECEWQTSHSKHETLGFAQLPTGIEPYLHFLIFL